MSIRQCPCCRSLSVRRSRRRGFVEFVLPLFLMRPYRCSVCFRRHYGSIIRSRHRYAPPRWNEVIYPLSQAVQLACLLVVIGGVLVFFSSPSYALKLLDGLAATHDRMSSLEATEQTDATPATAPQQPSGLTVSSSHLRVRTAAISAPSEVAVAETGSLASPPLAPQRQPVGSLRSSGEVLVNDFRVPETATVYAGDVVHTGLDGNAGLEVPNKGTILISPQTQISFNVPGYFANLTEGAVTLKTTEPVTNFQVQVGKFVVIPASDVENVAAEIEHAADGSSRVKALGGSVGVIDLDGVQTIFISTGEEITISPDGVLSKAGVVPQPHTANTRSPMGPGGGTPIPRSWLYLAGAGGGAAAIAAAVAGGGESTQSVSPSIP
jgi:hypothetical protein